MPKLLLTALLITLLTGCSSSATSLVDRGDFDPMFRSLNYKSHGYSVIPDPTGSAPTEMVERFEVRPGDCASSGGWSDCRNDRERSELSQRNKYNNSDGNTYWYSWSFYLPEDFPKAMPTKVALGQFHQERGKPLLMFLHSYGGLFIDRQLYGETQTMSKLIDEKDLRGKWHTIVMNVKWSRKRDGFVKIWVNDELEYKYDGKNLTEQSSYFKYGIYRSFLSRYKSAKEVDEVPTQVAYFTNVRKANSRERLQLPE